jgi:hypothetical protein
MQGLCATASGHLFEGRASVEASATAIGDDLG